LTTKASTSVDSSIGSAAGTCAWGSSGCAAAGSAEDHGQDKRSAHHGFSDQGGGRCVTVRSAAPEQAIYR
jgi:hypothetical protein